MKQVLKILTIWIIFISCIKENVHTQEESYIEAVLHGDKLKTRSLLNPYIRLEKVFQGDDYYVTLIWQMEEWINDFNTCTMYIRINYPFPVDAGKYYFNNDEFTINHRRVAAYFQGWEADGTYINYYSINGYIEITSIENEYVNGTFDFTVENTEKEIIEVSEGKFKAKIRHVVF